MNISTILFDLDGTLLPMNQDEFSVSYFKLLCRTMAKYNYDPEKLTKAILKGIYVMIKNNGQKSNEEVFWNCFAEIFGERVYHDKKYFDEFYENEFQQAKQSCGYDPNIPKIIETLKLKNLRIVLATNPIFPKTATESRIRWAGLEPSDFELYTTYENICYCKPNPEYYIDILKKLNLRADECIMIGNDITEDMIAKTLGIDVFLVTNCLINKNNEDISKFPNGNTQQMLSYILSKIDD